MRSSGRVLSLILISLLGPISAVGDDGCLKPFLEQLAEGKSTVSGFQVDCAIGKEKELAQAIAEFLVRSRPSASISVLQMIRDESARKEGKGKSFYTEFSSNLQEFLINMRPEIATNKNLVQLDPLIAALKQADLEEHRKRSGNIKLISDMNQTLNQEVSDLRDQHFWHFWGLLSITCLNLAGLAVLLWRQPLRTNDAKKLRPATAALADEDCNERQPGHDHEQWSVHLQRMDARCNQIEKEVIRQTHESSEAWNERLQALESTFARGPAVTVADLQAIQKDLSDLKHEVYELRNAPKPAVPSAPIHAENELLAEAWKRFRDSKEFFAALAARWKAWEGLRNPLLVDLPRLTPEEVKPTLDMVLTPARDFDTMITKINLVPLLLANKLPRLPDPQELTRLRELSNLLILIMSSNLVADRLNFRVELWIADQFVNFADLYLQRYQQAQMDGHQGPQNPLEPGLQIIRPVLKIIDLEPVELTPGQTPFDSARHIGRSTASNPSFANGVIVGVIRNGFVRGGREVIRQPEVIVNRVA